MQGNIEKETLAILRDGIGNGNKIGENIVIIKREPGHGFTSIGHLINKELLRECRARMDGKTRPLSIYCYEYKLVHEVLRRILGAVFEPHFYEEMMGFRPGRGCHHALRLLNTYIEKRYTGCGHQVILQ